MLLLRWVISALALLLVTYLVPGFYVQSFGYALIVALVIGLVNAVLRPLLILLTLPVTILTLGLFVFVINALLLMLVGAILEGFDVNGFVPALIGGILLWVISWLTNSLLKAEK